MTAGEALLLTRSDVAALLDLPACIEAVEEAFRLHGAGKTATPGILGFPYPGGTARTARHPGSRRLVRRRERVAPGAPRLN